MDAASDPTKTEAKPVNLLQAVNMALNDAMEADDKVLVLGEGRGRPGGGRASAASPGGCPPRFGDARVRSTPISEQAIIGAAIGAAMAGYKPVAEIMLMNFTTVAMDMIVNHAAKLRFMSGGQTGVPIVIRMMTGTGFASGGQHSDYLEAWFAHTAGLKVVAPSNPRRRLRPDALGHRRPGPGDLHRERPELLDTGSATRTGREYPAGPSQGGAGGDRRDPGLLFAGAERMPRGG